MDFGAFLIGGISVIALVLGIVEAAKRWGLAGKWCQVLALVLGTMFVALSQAIQVGIVPAAWVPWIEVVVIGLGGGLAATGVFDLANKLLKGIQADNDSRKPWKPS